MKPHKLSRLKDWFGDEEINERFLFLKLEVEKHVSTQPVPTLLSNLTASIHKNYIVVYMVVLLLSTTL